MKWHQYYQQILFGVGIEDVNTLVESIANGRGFPAKFINCEMFDGEGNLIDERLNDEPEIRLIIESIVADPKFARLTMVVKTSGVLPAGVKHGYYKLTFNDQGGTINLHEEMFEDEEMPERPPQTE